MPVATIEWKNGKVRMIDQTRLPLETVYLECADAGEVWHAIKRLSVRGAPALGVAGGYGVCVGVQHSRAKNYAEFKKEVDHVADYLAAARPTAVNLSWATQRMKRVVAENAGLSVAGIKKKLLEEAHAIFEEDRKMCRQIGEHMLPLLKDGATVLTHCNAGGLATSDYGTALSGIFKASEKGMNIHVYADETRPLLQGARLTTWELMQAGIDVTLICDNMAAHVMKEKKIDCVIVGADRIAANGDTANKIGTYYLALAARVHRIPFYIAAPSSTLDLSIATGKEIPIEERAEEEITEGFGRRTAPKGVKVYNPAFDVTPHELITAIVTEKGILRPPYRESLRKSVEK